MNLRSEIVCVWSGLFFAATTLLGFILSDFIPPASPNLSAEEIAAIFRDNTLSMRFGALLIMTGGAFMTSFAAAIAMQTKRIEGGIGPYTMTQACSGSLTALIFVFAAVFWTGAAFRVDRAPEEIMMLHDLGWVTMLMTFGPFIVQNIALGLCILGDKSDSPALPRWLGYINLWVAVSFMPGGLLTFFKTGPFAWDGLFVWWIPFSVFFTWYVTMPFILRHFLKRQMLTASEAT